MFLPVLVQLPIILQLTFSPSQILFNSLNIYRLKMLTREDLKYNFRFLKCVSDLQIYPNHFDDLTGKMRPRTSFSSKLSFKCSQFCVFVHVLHMLVKTTHSMYTAGFDFTVTPILIIISVSFSLRPLAFHPFYLTSGQNYSLNYVMNSILSMVTLIRKRMTMKMMKVRIINSEYPVNNVTGIF